MGAGLVDVVSALCGSREEKADQGELGRGCKCVFEHLLELVAVLNDEASLVVDELALLVCLGAESEARADGSVAGGDVLGLALLPDSKFLKCGGLCINGLLPVATGPTSSPRDS